jgi:hypothetical protein
MNIQFAISYYRLAIHFQLPFTNFAAATSIIGHRQFIANRQLQMVNSPKVGF